MEFIAGIVGPLIIEVGKGMFNPIKRHFNYLCCFNSNLQSLKNEAENLERANERLERKVGTAQRNTQVIHTQVNTWLEGVIQKRNTINDIVDREAPKVQNGCSNLISRYSLSRKVLKTVESLKEFIKESNFDQVAEDAPPAAMSSIPLGPKEKFTTRKKIEDDVMEALRERKDSMIGLCGMGGVGKTTLAEKIVDRLKDEKLFDAVVYPVVVSQKVDLHKMQREIADLLGLPLTSESLSARAYEIRRKLLGIKNTLIVIDDVWKHLELKDLGIPTENTPGGKCTVLLTSRDKHALLEMNAKIFGMEVLSEAEAWSLFREKTGNCVEGEDLRSVAEDIAKECKGLPLALVTVGRTLKDKDNRRSWDHALSQLRKSNPSHLNRVLEDVYRPLKLSFDNLNNEVERSLFLLCSTFDEDANIDLEDLTLYGVGLDMFKDFNNLKEVRDCVCESIRNLQDGSLLLDGYDENHVKMHDVVRDMAIFVASKEKSYSWNTDLLEGLGNTWYMCKAYSWISTKYHVLHLNFANELPDEFFDKISELRVLSMAYIETKSFPPSMQRLGNLKTLVLNRSKIKSISIVGKLSMLEVLRCDWCDAITEVPMEIGELKHLRLLQITKCMSCTTVAEGVLSNLVSLEELDLEVRMMDVHLQELKSLKNLTRLKIHAIVSKDSIGSEDIWFPSKMEEYDIAIFCEDLLEEYELLERDSFVDKRLYLHVIPEQTKLGKWIQKLLRSSQFLSLEGDAVNQVNSLELENIKSLEVGSSSAMKELVSNSRAFHQLEHLSLYRLHSLRHLFPVSSTTNLSHLEELEISNCEAMESIFYNDNEMAIDNTITFPKLRKMNLSNTTQKILNVIEAPQLKELSLNKLKNFDGNIAWFSFSFLNNLVVLKVADLDIKNLMSVSIARKFSCLKELSIDSCRMMSEVIADDDERQRNTISLFPALSKLELISLPELRSFFDWKQDHSLEMPLLEYVSINDCKSIDDMIFYDENKMETNVLLPKLRKMHLGNPTKEILNKIEALRLEELHLSELDYNLSSIEWISSRFLNNLAVLEVGDLGVKNLMSLSIARNFSCLRQLAITQCRMMSEVITDDDDDDEQQNNQISMFPALLTLYLSDLPELKSFCQWKHDHDLEMPSLEYVHISYCPHMESFSTSSVSTPKLYMVFIDYWMSEEIKDVNKALELRKSNKEGATLLTKKKRKIRRSGGRYMYVMYD